MLAFIERLRDRRAMQRQAEIVLAANLAIKEIKRRTIQEILNTGCQSPIVVRENVIDSTAIVVDSVEIERS
jgi:hypothetical protein